MQQLAGGERDDRGGGGDVVRVVHDRQRVLDVAQAVHHRFGPTRLEITDCHAGQRGQGDPLPVAHAVRLAVKHAQRTQCVAAVID